MVNRTKGKDLIEPSVKVLRRSQTEVGGFLSYPGKMSDRIFRLGHSAFVSFALDLGGEHDASKKFYTWILNVLKGNTGKIDAIADNAKKGHAIKGEDRLPIFYNHDGSIPKSTSVPGIGDYGALLWGLAEHVHKSGDETLLDKYNAEIISLIKYLSILWPFPGMDFWGKDLDKIHLSTLAQVVGGLNWVNAYLMRSDVDSTSNEIQSFLWSRFLEGDHFATCYDVSKEAVNGLDATVILVSEPFQVVPTKDPILQRTIEIAESRLLKGGALREASDEERGVRWIPDTLLFALHYKSCDRQRDLQRVLAWIETISSEDGELPDSVAEPQQGNLRRSTASSKNGQNQGPSTLSHALYIMAVLPW